MVERCPRSLSLEYDTDAAVLRQQDGIMEWRVLMFQVDLAFVHDVRLYGVASS